MLQKLLEKQNQSTLMPATLQPRRSLCPHVCPMQRSAHLTTELFLRLPPSVPHISMSELGFACLFVHCLLYGFRTLQWWGHIHACLHVNLCWILHECHLRWKLSMQSRFSSVNTSLWHSTPSTIWHDSHEQRKSHSVLLWVLDATCWRLSHQPVMLLEHDGGQT